MSSKEESKDHVEPEEKSNESNNDVSSEESEAEPVDWLVAGRAKRAGAGNKYRALLAVELEKAAEEAAAAAEDELALLFEEDEEDIEFDERTTNEGAVSDVEDDDSSSDDEDKDPVAGEDDLEGEVALQKEERSQRRLEKRKADKAFSQPTTRLKRVKIDEQATTGESTPQQTIERRRKKSERVSWIPTNTEAPVRASSRTLAVQNKQRTLASMKESEARRVKQIAQMEQAQKLKNAAKPEPMTQAQRLAEAAKTERLNSKSLNRWEEMEKERAEKQRLRLEALQNRKLEGPVIRWYSGPAEWKGDKLVHVGKSMPVEEAKEEVKDTIQVSVPETKEKSGKSEKQATTIAPISTPQIVAEHNREIDPSETENNTSLNETAVQSAIGAAQEHSGDDTKSLSGFLHGIQDYASLPEASETVEETHKLSQTEEETDRSIQNQENHVDTERAEPESNHNASQPLTADTITKLDLDTPAPDAVDQASQPQFQAAQPPRDAVDQSSQPQNQTAQPPPDAMDQSTQPLAEAAQPPTDAIDSSSEPQAQAAQPPPDTIDSSSEPQAQAAQPLPDPVDLSSQPEPPAAAAPPPTQAPTPPPPLPTTLSTRNQIHLLNFNPTATHSKDTLRRILFSWGPAPTPPSTTTHLRKEKSHATSAYNPFKPIQPVCAITGKPAKYLDPLTGLPYASLEAFKALRRCVSGAGAMGDAGMGGVWSSVLGAWVGGGGVRPAKGVPQGFSGIRETGGEEVEVEGAVV